MKIADSLLTRIYCTNASIEMRTTSTITNIKHQQFPSESNAFVFALFKFKIVHKKKVKREIHSTKTHCES